MDIDKILPMNLEIKYNYIEIDGTFICTIAIIKNEANLEMLETLSNLMCLDEIEISMHYERKNSAEILKELTKIISTSGSEMKTVSKNQIDINVINEVKQNAVDLRKKIQVDNEQIYLVSIYILIKDKNLKQLLLNAKRVINELYAKKIISKMCNFRQKEGYIATLPFVENPSILSKHTKCIYTEKGITKLFPFYSKEVFEENGIIIGRTNNNLCAIDIFSPKNNNYNLAILGTSGVGKSYFVKLLIIKNAYKRIRQVVIDPEGEYESIVKELGGEVITKENFNLLYLNEAFVNYNENYFDEKINSIAQFLCEKCKVENIEKVKECLEKTYLVYGITRNKESLYKKADDINIYANPKYTTEFPTLHDFFKMYKNLFGDNIEEYNSILKNFDLKNISSKNMLSEKNIYCISLKNKSKEEITEIMRLIFPFLNEVLRDKTLIYFDEVWKIIINDNFAIQNIYNMFKTFRKRKSGIAIISQDITDLFNVDNGNFGKSILNNSNIKVMFKMEWADIEIFERLGISKEKLETIRSLDRGNSLMSIGNTSFNVQIKATGYEHNLIEGEEMK